MDEAFTQFAELDDFEFREHANGTRARLIGGNHQSGRALIHRQRLTISLIGDKDMRRAKIGI